VVLRPISHRAEVLWSVDFRLACSSGTTAWWWDWRAFRRCRSRPTSGKRAI